MFKRSCLIITGIIGLLICIALGIGLYLVRQEQKEVREKYGEDVASLCDVPGGGIASLDNLTSGEGQIQVAMLTDNGMYHKWHNELPDDLRAEDRAALDIVICLEERSTTVETCPYGDEDNEDVFFTIERKKALLDIIMLSPDGQRIYETTLTGDMPDKCPTEARRREGSTDTINGAAVSFNDFYIELTRFIEAQG